MNRMIKIKTPLVIPARAASLDEFESLVFNSFENRTVRLYEDFNKENSEEYKKQYLYTLNFYEIFNNGTNNIKPCQSIEISEDNIVFKTTIYPRENFKKKAEMKKDGAILASDNKDITSISSWQQLFGQGEFPFIIIRVFKLGGIEYFTYSITR